MFLFLFVFVAYTLPRASGSRFDTDVQNEKTKGAGYVSNFCCSDYYIEPAGDATSQAEYLAHLVRNQKMSCANPLKTDKCGTIVATRNTHQFPDAHTGGVHCIETKSCLECIEHFQILCGPGFTWDRGMQKCTWRIPADIAQQYDFGTYVRGTHGAHSCIVLKANGYPILRDKNNPEKTDCTNNECYGAYYNTDIHNHPATMVGEAEFVQWDGASVNKPLGYTPSPTVTHLTPPPTPPPTLPPNWEEQYTDENGDTKTMQDILLGDFCCNRFFNDGEIGMPKEIFQEGIEYAPGPHNSLLNQMISNGAAAVGRRRLKAYDSSGELPTFEEFYFGGFEACGHAPPVDTECGRVVSGNGLSLAGHVTSNSEFAHYLGGAHCGDVSTQGAGSVTPGSESLCKKCLKANVIACASGYSWDEGTQKCSNGGDNPCANFEHECHVQPHDQLVADPIPCLKVSGHIANYTAGDDSASDAACAAARYTASRTCVWDHSSNKCKAGVFFGSASTPTAFAEICAVKTGVVSCEHTIWEETMTCQSVQRVAYPIRCTSGLSYGEISCDPAARSIPPSHDTDDVCTVLQHRQGELKMYGTVKYDEKEIMATLEHLCHWPKESTTHKFVEWMGDLNTLELVAFIFLLLPIVGTLLCTANAVFKWNTGCCRACCANRGIRSVRRRPVTPVVKSNVSAGSIAVGQSAV